MCETFGTDDHLAVIRQGREAADEILSRYLRVDILKAYDMGSPRGFDRAVTYLAGQLRSRASASDQDAVLAAIQVLDVDWKNTTATQRRELISQSLNAAGRKTAIVSQKTQVVFDDAADEVVQASRVTARRKHKLAIAADFNALDKRIAGHLKTSQAAFVRDEYGRRSAVFSQKARDIVSRGLESGLGRADIARDLEAAAQATLAGKGSFYWDVLAGSFISRGRSFATLSAFKEAGIERYAIEAVLDEATTDTCRFLHGKVFSVKSGIDLFKRAEAKPDELKNIAPWVRTDRDGEGHQHLFVKRNDQRTSIATIQSSGAGIKDDRGTFSNSVDEKSLESLGVSVPPFHGLCRSTLISI